MSIDQIAVPLMIVAAVTGAILFIANIAGAFLYDMAEVKRLRAMRQHPHARAYRKRPIITVVVSTHNDAERITGTLDSILRSGYRKVEVIIVDHGSSDMTKRIVKGYIDTHQNQSIRLVARRDGANRKRALKRAVKQHSNGDLIMPISAGGYIGRGALGSAVQHFIYDADIDALNLNEQVDIQVSVTGLFERYLTLLTKRQHKFMSITGLMVNISQVAVYRRSAFVGEHARTWLTVRYAHDTQVTLPAPASSFQLFGRKYQNYVLALKGQRRHLSWASIGYVFCTSILSLCGPFLIGYFSYIALYLHESRLLLLSVAGLSAFLVIAIGEESRLNTRQKMAHVFGVPITFCLFYFLSLTRLVALVSAPINRQVTDS
jgi:glycosyltransferase involved in cell wall biosynthesis